ncbi:hypothetical protein Lal_00019366 [Lupinus albus]|nr:hypothetical protein Lal_00019366 [Lupinus albus]
MYLKSNPSAPLSVSSASVAGGLAPPPAHSTLPEPQSAVTHENIPSEPRPQRVRAHSRPDQDLGILMVLDLPLRRAKPVVGSGGEVAPESSPGHIVWWHLFTILNDVDCTSATTRLNVTVKFKSL